MNWMGAFVLVMSSYFIGIKLSQKEGEGMKALESIISLLRYMKRRMTAENQSLLNIFSSYKDEYLSNCGFLNKLCKSQSSFPILWRDAVSLLPLSENAKRELFHFSRDLGKLPLEEQILRIDSCCEALSKELSEIRIALPKKQKSIKTVCSLFGLLTAIILL